MAYKPPESQRLYTGPTADDLDRIPADLKVCDQWILWRGADKVDEDTGEIRLDKVPIDPQTLCNASTTDPRTWGTFAQCVTALPVALEEWETDDPSAYRGGGVGFVLSGIDAFCGIDLDHCRTIETGEIAPWALLIIAALGSYSEISPSGEGVHIWVQGTLPPKGRKKGSVEMYVWGRFLTMTGQHIQGTPHAVEARQDALTAVHAAHIAPPPPSSQHTGTTPLIEDAALLAKARAARNGAKFTRLWDGDTSMHGGDDSRTDLALCCALAFWTQDPIQLDRLFRQSGLIRAKWDEQRGAQTYGARTILEALALQTEHYSLRDEAQRHRNGDTPEPAIPEDAEAEAWQQTLKCTKGGEIKETFANLVLTLQHLPPWASDCWYDVVRELPMCGMEALSDAMVGRAALDLERHGGIPIRNLRLVQAALVQQCRSYPRDVLQEWLAALPPWDHISRLTDWLCEHAGAPKTAYGMDISRLLPVSMIARAENPGCQYRNVVILEGREDLGKSKLVKVLSGPSWYRELSHGLEGKESHMILAGVWLAELAELASLSKTEDARLKSFITMETDDYIPKFANAPVSRRRRTVFVGTINPEADGTYLRGQTGNTRFLPIPVTDIHIDDVLTIRDQLFAEALVYYRKHPLDWWQLSSDGQREAVQEREARRQGSVYEESLHAWLKGRTQTTWEEIAQYYLLLDAKEKWKDKGLQMEVAKALRALKWQSRQKWNEGRNVRLWFPEAPTP